MQTAFITGRCYCGKVRYRTRGPVKFSGNCHCKNCRQAAGAQAVAWVSVPKIGFKFTRGTPARYRSKTQAYRTFCPACGTTLTYESVKRTKDIDITTGSLTRPEMFAPRHDFFVKEKLPWVALVGTR